MLAHPRHPRPWTHTVTCPLSTHQLTTCTTPPTIGWANHQPLLPATTHHPHPPPIYNPLDVTEFTKHMTHKAQEVYEGNVEHPHHKHRKKLGHH